MATYLVTGAAGFIGSHIVDALASRGEVVRALDNLVTGRIENLHQVLDKIELVRGDVRDPALLAEVLAGVDFVVHQAAVPSVPRSLADPFLSHDANATGTLQLLIAARDAGVKRVVYASSSSVYGDSPTLPKHEEMPTGPLSPYAVSKLAGEEYCKVFTHVFALPTVSLRYFNVFGPRQDPTSQYAAVIPAFVSAMLRGERPTIYGDGTQTRDFTYVSNVVEANLLACESESAVGSALNVAGGRSYSLLDLVREINMILDTDLEPMFEPERKGDVKHSLADITRAGEQLGYAPKVDLRGGLEETVRYMRGQNARKAEPR